ncbi:MBL fold metallo-hydrolase [Altererythrobacter salegens]|uniref:MBL fold metallo-hydrolase n=1 Tax=Croceibacterium salegens TaxID=1737568 RepID=A0A6I4SSH8_9SPHN|nr:MBL fold metallo-hydrolase [Croceibacterium salegens]MXO58833.1 MBL fold metallo-hydrolase [Croceibacterium salegens]
MKSHNAIAATILLLTSGSAAAQSAPDGTEIRAVEVKPGIAVLYGFGGNIGVSYGPDGTILIDDQVGDLTPKIQAAVASLGASPARFVVNTHWHWDHAMGNENFGKAGATIVAHNNVRPRLIKGGTVTGIVSEPAPHVALPVVTYDHGMTLHVNGDTLDIRFLGGGHTDGDSVVFWRDANVVHMGDLFMHNLGWPFIDIESGGNVEHHLATLAQVISQTDGATVVIPGHGELATRSDLIAFRSMVETGVGRVRVLKDAGKTLQAAIAAKPLAGLSNAEGGFVTDDQFVEAVWKSLDAHGH